MTYGEIFNEFLEKTKIPRGLIGDYRPCCDLYDVPNLPNAIVIWLRDESKLIYISNKKELTKMTYVETVYEIIKKECEGRYSIYEDYIVSLVGKYGLDALKAYGKLEDCGVLNGRQLYVLC